MTQYSKNLSPAKIVDRFHSGRKKTSASIVRKFVKAARTCAEMSPSQLAQKSGIALSTLGEYESHGYRLRSDDNKGGNDDRGVNLSTLITIAHACGLNLAVVVAPKDARPKNEKTILFSSRYKERSHICKKGGKIYIAMRELRGENQNRHAVHLNINRTLVSRRETGVNAQGEYVSPILPTLLDTAKKSGCRLTLALCRR